MFPKETVLLDRILCFSLSLIEDLGKLLMPTDFWNKNLGGILDHVTPNIFQWFESFTRGHSHFMARRQEGQRTIVVWRLNWLCILFCFLSHSVSSSFLSIVQKTKCNYIGLPLNIWIEMKDVKKTSKYLQLWIMDHLVT